MLSNLMRRLAWRRSKDSLAFISGPREVVVRGEIISDEVVSSPETGREAAVLSFYLGERDFEDASGGDFDSEAGPGEVHTVLASVTRAASLVIETEEGRVFIPHDSAEVVNEGDPLRGAAQVRAIPEPVDFVNPDANAIVVYREQSMKRGERVELKAVLGPSRREGIVAELVPERMAYLGDLTLEELDDFDFETRAAIRGQSSPVLLIFFPVFLAVVALLFRFCTQ